MNLRIPLPKQTEKAFKDKSKYNRKSYKKIDFEQFVEIVHNIGECYLCANEYDCKEQNCGYWESLDKKI